MYKPPKGLPWIWTPGELRPEFARLVARPILVLPMARFGSTPIEYARKQSAIVNAPTTTLWVDTPYGPALYFPNATYGTPLDYLKFRGTYPLSNGSIVPHSVAILYSPRTTNGGQYNFALGSNDTGARSLGICCDFGGNKFNIVHFGVVGFSAIGSTPVVGRYYLQLYSYDQVTMNHLVRDLTTGAVASQSVAETRALVTASPGPYVGYVGGNEATQGNIVAVAWVRGAWTINEMEMIARTPTALWMPDDRRRRIVYKAPSGGSIASGAGQSQSDSTAAGAGASIASGAAASLAASVAFAAGVAIVSVAGNATSPSKAQGTPAPIAAGAGVSLSASTALASNDNIVQGAGASISPSTAAAAGVSIASGDGRSTSPSKAAAASAAIAAGSGVSLSVSLVRAPASPIAVGLGVSLSLSRVIGDTTPPFNQSTLVAGPHYTDFDSLETFIEFDDLAYAIVFLTPQGAEVMGPLKLYQGEVRDVAMVLRGAGSVPLDLTLATSRKWTVGEPGKPPVVNAADLTVVAPATNGRVFYPAVAALASAGGRYKSLAVITYPGGVIVKVPGDVLIESAIA